MDGSGLDNIMTVDPDVTDDLYLCSPEIKQLHHCGGSWSTLAALGNIIHALILCFIHCSQLHHDLCDNGSENASHWYLVYACHIIRNNGAV